MSFLTPPTEARRRQLAAEQLGALVRTAQAQPDRTLDLHDQSGAVVATLIAYDLPKRPKDMPRALRPKVKLSKRQRDAVKRARLRPPSGS